MNREFKPFLWGVLSASLLMALVSADRIDFNRGESIKVFLNAFRELSLAYVDEPDPEKMAKDALNGMMRGLDPYTTYMDRAESEEFEESTTGEYGGIGAVISKMKGDEYAEVAEVIEGSPAHKSGLTIGDKIMMVDDKELKNVDNSEVSRNLRGKAGSTFKLKYHSLLEDVDKEIKVKRNIIHTSSVPYSGFIKGSNGVGYISLTTFSSNSFNEVKAALEELQSSGELKGLILDLRSNGGGLLQEAVKIVSLFVDKGTVVVKVDGRSYSEPEQMTTIHDPIARELPLIVMVNSSSASASEVVAGAIQDLDRGLIVGEQTFGKGLVQNTRNLGAGSLLKLTTAKYYTPSGRCIQAVDFSHRKADGSVGTIPDSLRKEFKTAAGRIVFDGGGIQPDSTIKREDYTRFVQNIANVGDYLPSFVKEYFKSNPDKEIVPGEFKVDDELLEQFADHLEKMDFEVLTLTKYHLDEMKKAAKSEHYSAKIENEIAQIEENLKLDIREDIELNKEPISQLLEMEIVVAYKFQRGRVEHFAQSDSSIKQAVKLFYGLDAAVAEVE